jgi:hypothetical protein
MSAQHVSKEVIQKQKFMQLSQIKYKDQQGVERVNKKKIHSSYGTVAIELQPKEK